MTIQFRVFTSFSPDPEVLESIGILPGRKELFWRFIEGEKNEKSKILFFVSEQFSSRGNVLTPASLKKFGLSPREAEVAALAAQGFAMLNIATRLNITRNTVHTHLKRFIASLMFFHLRSFRTSYFADPPLILR